MIYNEIDYYTYINNNCDDDTIKKRIFNIFKNFRGIEDIISNIE